VPLIYAVCRCYLDRWTSFAGAIIFSFGSPVMSTFGSAWWSSGPTMMLHLCVLLMLLRDSRRPGSIRPSLLALLLGASYLCRPTASIFVVAVLAYLMVCRRRVLLHVLGVLAIGGGLFVLFSWTEYGSLLPPYYLPSRLGASTFWVALAGNLVSPSRGLLVLCPYLLVAAVTGAFLAGRLRRDPFFWLGAGWFIAHWITISSYTNWWGGWCFGNRLFADAFPSLILMTASIARELRAKAAPSLRAAAQTGFVLTGLAGIWIHSHQGLYDRYPFLWCQDGSYVEHLFEWRHPQFLASAASMREHRRAHLLPELPPQRLDEPIGAASRGALFEGFSRPEGNGGWRWSDGHRAAILLRIESAPATEPASVVTMTLVAGTYKGQTVFVTVNGTEVGELSGQFPTWFTFEVDPVLLGLRDHTGSGARNLEIGFDIPDPWDPWESRPPRGSDQRRLGVRFGSLRLTEARAAGPAT
jgi:hypothetical protein